MSQNRPVIIALVVVGLLIIGFIIYSVTSSDPKPEVVTQKIAIPQPEPEPVIEEPEPQYVPPPVSVIPVEEEIEEVAPAFWREIR